MKQLLRFLFAHQSELKTEGTSKRLIKGAMAALFYVCTIVGYVIFGCLLKNGVEIFNINMLSNGMLVLEIALSLVGDFVLLVISRSIWLAAYDIENSDAKEVMKEIGPFWLAYIGALDILARLFT